MLFTAIIFQRDWQFMILTTTLEILMFLWIFMVPTVSALEISVVPDQSIFGISVGESMKIGISVLDENNQPINDIEVERIEESGPFSVTPGIQTTDNQGKAFFDVSASDAGCGSILFSVNGTSDYLVTGVANLKEIEIGNIVVTQGSTPPCCPEFDISIEVFDDHGQPLEGIYVGAVSNIDEHPVDSCQITDTNGRAVFYLYDVFWLYSRDDYPIVVTIAAGDTIASTEIYPIRCEVWPDPDKESLHLMVGEEDTITIRTQAPCAGDVDAEVCLGYDSEFIYVRPSRCQNSGSDARATFNILGLKPGETYITLEYGLAWDIDVTIEPTSNVYASGRVMNSTTMEEIEGATVELVGSNINDSTVTLKDGSYIIELQSGLSRLIASENNYYKTTWTGQAKPGEVITVDFPLNPLPLPGEPAISSATFSGEIKNAMTGESIKGDDWFFFLFPNGLLINDVGEGEFREEGLPPGFYQAVLLKWGYLPWFHLFELEEGETAMLAVELIPLWVAY